MYIVPNEISQLTLSALKQLQDDDPLNVETSKNLSTLIKYLQL